MPGAATDGSTPPAASQRPTALRRANRAVLAEAVRAIPAGTTDVVMFVRSPLKHDARVQREVGTLADAGLRVVVFSAADDPSEVGIERSGSTTVVKIFYRVTYIRVFLRSLTAFQKRYRTWSRRRSRVMRLPFGVGWRLAARLRRALGGPGPADAAGGGRSLAARVGRAEAAMRRLTRPRPGTRPLGVRWLIRFRRFARARTWSVNGSLYTIYFVRVTAKAARALAARVYHCHDEQTMPAGVRAARGTDAKIVYDSHELYPHRNRLDPAWWKTAAFERADRRYARRADAVITVSQAIADHMQERYGIGPVDVIMNTPALPPDGIEPVYSLAAIPQTKLFYTGNITHNRGLDESIRALALLPDCALVVLGLDRVGYKRTLRELAEGLGVADRVHFLDPVPFAQVASIASQADLAVILIRPICLSYVYALPNKFFESLHSGLPIVTSDLPELRRMVETLGVGAVCDQEDPRAIAAAVRAVIGDPAATQRHREHARAAAPVYCWEQEQAKLLDLYRRIGVLPGDAARAPTKPADLPGVQDAS